MQPNPNIKRPWSPATCDYHDVMAIKQVAEGVADAATQRRALGWIIAIARTRNETYYPDSERDSCFAQGMRFVGLQVLRLVEMRGAELETLRAAAMPRGNDAD